MPAQHLNGATCLPWDCDTDVCADAGESSCVLQALRMSGASCAKCEADS